MAVDKLKVRLDATNYMIRSLNPAVHGSVNIKDADAQAVKSGVWVEPITGTLMMEPLQFAIDAYKNTEIERNGTAWWHYSATGLALDTHWDEVTREQEKWLLSDGTTDKITCNRVFPKNSGFMFKFRPMGTSDDTYTALTLNVGQWVIVIRSDGYTTLSHEDDAASEPFRATGWITTTDRRRMCDYICSLVIMPLPNGLLYIRQSGVNGFTYRLPADEWQKGTDAVIEAGDFSITPGDARLRFELTQLLWPYDATGVDTYTFITPTYKFIRPPVTGVSIHVDVVDDFPEDAAGGWSVYVTDTDGETAFVPDSSKTDYKVRFELFDSSSKRNATPSIMAARVRIDPDDPADPTDPAEITSDVSSLSYSCGDSPADTEARFTLRNTDDHPIFGEMNRLCAIEVGTKTLLYGILKEPPRYHMAANGQQEIECIMTSMAKYLQEQSLTQAVQFDGMAHTTAVKWLCYFAGLVDSDLEFDEDTTPLPDTRKQDASEKSELQPDWGEKPLDWIERICDETGFQFIDGYGNEEFVFKYIDPLALSTTSVHTFCMDSDDCDSTESYQRLDGWDVYSLEPEANELYLISTDDYGRRIAARYWDKQSQEATPPDPTYDHWLGIRRICVATCRERRKRDWLERTCLRIGLETCRRRDFAVFHAEYPADKQLWKYDAVTIWDSTIGTKQSGIGASGKSLYRILNISNIEFRNEAIAIPQRWATYEAVKIGEVVE